MLSIVLDTVVFVRSLINPHSRCGQIVFAHSSSFRLVLSQPVLVEIIEVLRRPELTRKFRNLAGLDHERVLDIISQVEVVPIEAPPAVSRDPTDDKFLATARAAGADYLVSEDKDLLSLEYYRGTRIVDCATFLTILGRQSSTTYKP